MLNEFPEYHFCIAKVPSIEQQFYDKLNNKFNSNRLRYIENDTYNLLVNSEMAMVTSGTATLEAALFNVPQVVCYKTSWLSYQVGKRLIKVNYISLVNLILNTNAIVELIQDDFNPKKMAYSLRHFNNSTYMDATLKHYKKLQKLMGSEGAAKLVAEGVIASLS